MMIAYREVWNLRFWGPVEGAVSWVVAAEVGQTGMIIELSYVEHGLEEGNQPAGRRPLPGSWRDSSEGNPWVGKFPWRRKWKPTPVFLPGESHGQRSLVGYSPQGCKELGTTERPYLLTYLLTYLEKCMTP